MVTEQLHPPGDRRRDRWATAVRDLRSAQKAPRGVSLYTLHVNRRLARPLAALAFVAGLTPNAVTTLSALCSFAGIAVLALSEPSWPVGVAAALLLALGFVLDSADGQLARLRGGGSATGELLDHVLDCATKLALHVAVLIAWYRHLELEAGLLLPLLFQLAAVLLFVEGTLVGVLLAVRPGGADSAPRPPSTLRAAAMLPLDHGVLCLTFLLWGAQELFAPVYALLAVAQVLALVVFSRHWWRRLGGAA